MAVCLSYQAVYSRKESVWISRGMQFFCASLLVASLLFRVWLSTKTTQTGYLLARERQKTIELDMERRELELHLSVLLRPDNLAERATKKLGLQPLNPQQARKVLF